MIRCSVCEKNKPHSYCVKTDIHNLGQRIYYLRKLKKLTLDRLSKESGISKGNLSDIENGKKDPRFTTLQAIALGLDLTVHQLLKDV